MKKRYKIHIGLREWQCQLMIVLHAMVCAFYQRSLMSFICILGLAYIIYFFVALVFIANGVESYWPSRSYGRFYMRGDE